MTKEKVIKSPEEFTLMTSSEICKLMNVNKSYAIKGYEPGVDRRIIQRKANTY